jgi:hypothetical protein
LTNHFPLRRHVVHPHGFLRLGLST